MNCCAPSKPESITANVLSRCEGTVCEITEKLQQLREDLLPVLQQQYPQEVPKLSRGERDALPPFASRLDDHNDKLLTCIAILQDINERLAI